MAQRFFFDRSPCGDGDLLDRGGFAADNEDLQAVVVVEVDVEGGDYYLVVVVLDVGQRGLDVLLVVVVNESDGAGDFLVAEVLAMLDEAGADHVGHSQGAVVVALLFGHLVKLLGQVAGNGHGKADNAVSFVAFHAGDGSKGSGGVNRWSAGRQGIRNSRRIIGLKGWRRNKGIAAVAQNRPPGEETASRLQISRLAVSMVYAKSRLRACERRARKRCQRAPPTADGGPVLCCSACSFLVWR